MNRCILRHMLLLFLSKPWNSAALIVFFLPSVAWGSDFLDDLSMHRLLPVADSASVIQAREQQDQHFQQAAFKVLDHHKTGEIYNVSSSTDAIVQAVRLRSGGLRKYGMIFNEFEIVRGCKVESSAERVLLVYESLSKSELFPMLYGYVLVGPIVGISVYNASEFGIKHPLPKLNIRATYNESIRIHLRLFHPGLKVTPFCAYFEERSLNVVIKNLSSTGVCHVSHLGFFSLVARRSLSPSPASASPLSAAEGHHGDKRSKTLKILGGSILGAFVLLAIIAATAVTGMKCRRRENLALMESRLDVGETLQTAFVRNSRTPVAASTRTKPVLESEYVSHI